MATLINNAGVQHYANKMVLAENRKVGSKNLPTALADIDNLIDEMKTSFDAEYGSALDMKLENNENVFSVGTGTNVDRRSEVENGFTDVELSGNSLVSILSSIYTTSAEISTSYKHIGDFIPNIKPKINQTYTILPLGRSDLTFSFASVYTENGGEYGIGSLRKFGTPFSFVLTKETTDIIKFRFYLHGNSVVIPNNTTVKFMIIEGDWTNKPIPQYFEGLKSIGEKEDGNHKISISSVGKNLFEPTVSQKSSSITANTQYSIENNGYSISISSSVNRPTTETASHIHFGEVKLKIGETYVVSADKMIKDTNTATPQIRIAYWDKQNNRYATIGYLTNHTSVFTFTVESGKEYVALGLYSHGALLTNGQTVKATYEGVRLYLKSTSNTSYEPHKSDKKEISLNEPLRGLPNGIRDTIEKVNGEWKIVRRCVEVTLNGSETSWNRNTDFNGTEVLFFFINTRSNTSVPEGAVKTNGNMVHLQCDSFPCYPLKDRVNNKNNNIEGIIYSDSSNPLIQFHINKSKLASEDLTGFKQWLSQNPTKVVYELATPIIEDISPVTLQCWKNGTISIDEVLPVETTHTVALNKPAQIKRNIEELTVLRKRVQALEDFYDQVALEQAHQLSLINNSIELDYDI